MVTNSLKPLAVLSFFLPIVACSSVDGARKHFKDSRDFDVGRKISSIPLQEPLKITSVVDGVDEYHYVFTNSDGKECAWIYSVDNQSKKVLSWRYVSSPSECYKSVRLGTPW